MDQGRKSLRLTNGKNTKLVPRDISQALGRIPPQALDLEEAVIGGILLEKEAMNTAIAASLKPEHFYDDRHKEIYLSCFNLFASGKPIDMRTVVNQLRTDGKLELVGGASAIVEITMKVSSAANIAYHIRVIQEKYMLRCMIDLASRIHHLAYEDGTDIFELIDRSSMDLLNLDVARSSQKKIMDMLMLMNDTIHDLQTKNNRGGLTGIPSGFQLLDRITSGWQNSDLIIIGGRPGSGKTAMLLCLCRHAAKEYPVAIFSLEMSAKQLGQRLISSDYSIENDKIRSGILSDEDWKRIGADPTKLSTAKMFIDDTANISIFEFRSKCMRLKKEKDIKMVVVDYLQLMKGEQGGNREQEISSIAKALKNVAKELDIPVIALSQLSRAVESRADKRPMLSDLRESGSIEQDADVIIFQYRPEYYKITVDEEGLSTAGICEVDVAKHRNGGTGMIKVRFQKQFTRFVDMDSDQLFPQANGPFVAPKEYVSKPKYDPSESRNKKNDPEMPF